MSEIQQDIPTPPPAADDGTLGSLMAKMMRELIIMDKARAGYDRLQPVWAQLDRGQQPGERLLGIPYISFPCKAVLDDPDSDTGVMTQCVLELRKVKDPAVLKTILAGMCDVLGDEIFKGIDNLAEIVVAMQAIAVQARAVSAETADVEEPEQTSPPANEFVPARNRDRKPARNLPC